MAKKKFNKTRVSSTLSIPCSHKKMKKWFNNIGDNAKLRFIQTFNQPGGMHSKEQQFIEATWWITNENEKGV